MPLTKYRSVYTHARRVVRHLGYCLRQPVFSSRALFPFEGKPIGCEKDERGAALDPFQRPLFLFSFKSWRSSGLFSVARNHFPAFRRGLVGPRNVGQPVVCSARVYFDWSNEPRVASSINTDTCRMRHVVAARGRRRKGARCRVLRVRRRLAESRLVFIAERARANICNASLGRRARRGASGVDERGARDNGGGTSLTKSGRASSACVTPTSGGPWLRGGPPCAWRMSDADGARRDGPRLWPGRLRPIARRSQGCSARPALIRPPREARAPRRFCDCRADLGVLSDPGSSARSSRTPLAPFRGDM